MIKRTYLYAVVGLVISLLYAVWLSSLPSILFQDREYYLGMYAVDFQFYLDNMNTIVAFLFSEPLFFYLNKLLFYFDNPDVTVQLIVFFICFSTALFCFRETRTVGKGVILLLFMFFNAQFFAMQLVVLRQGVGLAILLLLFPTVHKRRWSLLLLLTILGLIHNSFYIIATFYSIHLVLKNWFKIDSDNMLYLFLTTFGVGLNLVILILSTSLGVKQEYEDGSTSVGGGMFIVWLIVAIYVYVFKRKSVEEDIRMNLYCELALIGLIIYLTSYFLSPIAGRIIGTFVPFIYLLLLYKMTYKDLYFTLILVSINLYIFHNGGAAGFMDQPVSSFYKELFSIQS